LLNGFRSHDHLTDVVSAVGVDEIEVIRQGVVADRQVLNILNEIFSKIDFPLCIGAIEDALGHRLDVDVVALGRALLDLLVGGAGAELGSPAFAVHADVNAQRFGVAGQT
jgi:hypothetical protein